MSFENHVFNLKFSAKSLARQSKKSEKEEKKQRQKLKAAIEKGNVEGARIYAQNAIRAKNLGLNYLRLSSRVDAVASRIETAFKMSVVSEDMRKIVYGMESSMKSMNLEKISSVMDKFERQFTDLDVQSEYIESTINSTTALTTPKDEVDLLIAQTADEYNIDLKEKFPDINLPLLKEKECKAEDGDDLLSRLTNLKS